MSYVNLLNGLLFWGYEIPKDIKDRMEITNKSVESDYTVFKYELRKKNGTVDFEDKKTKFILIKKVKMLLMLLMM